MLRRKFQPDIATVVRVALSLSDDGPQDAWQLRHLEPNGESLFPTLRWMQENELVYSRHAGEYDSEGNCRTEWVLDSVAAGKKFRVTFDVVK